MKIKNIRTMSEKDIESKIDELRLELIKLEGQKATGTNPKNTGNIKKFKKTIAKMNMTITQKGKMPKIQKKEAKTNKNE